MPRIETVLSTTLTLAAVVVAATYTYKQLLTPGRDRATDNNPVFVPDWRHIAAKGVRVGPAEARVEILVFSDIECPFCRTAHKAIRELAHKYPGQIAYVFIHFPLPNHRFAGLAARAAECSREQNAFAGMLDLLFEKQDSLGLIPWSTMAGRVGVRDTIQFDACLGRPGGFAAIDAGLEIGKRIEILGTPTIVINGWRYSRGLSPTDLARTVTEILLGDAAISVSLNRPLLQPCRLLARRLWI